MIQINDSRLRSVELDDLTFIKNIRTSEDVQSSVGCRVFLNDDKQKAWFKDILENVKVLYAIFEIKNNNNWLNIGYVRITEIDHVNKSMMVGADLHASVRGKGYGRIVFKLLLELGFKQWAMNRLYLFVLESNVRARTLYEKVGFKVEGVQREAIYKNGRYEDYIMMSILRKDYL